MSKFKGFNQRIPWEIMEEVKKIAPIETRSANNTVIILLKEALKARKERSDARTDART